MMRRLKSYISVIVPLLILAAIVGLRMQDPGNVLEDLRLKVFDYYQRFQPRVYEPTQVRIVDLDDESLTKYGQWPWPRTLLGQLVKDLTEAGAAVIAFDIVFAEPDRTSPKQVVPLWPNTAELAEVKKAVDALPDHDEYFGSIIKEANVVTGFVLTSDEPTRPPRRKGTFAKSGTDDPSGFVPVFRSTVPNLPVLEDSAAGNGSFNILAERDQIIRRVPIVLCLAKLDGGEYCPVDSLYPSLAAEALRVAQGARTNIIYTSTASGEFSLGGHSGINAIKIGQFKIPTDEKGQVWVHYTNEVPERTVPAWRILKGEFDPEKIEGNIVFIGTSASGLKDLRASPLNPAMAGVEAHVQFTEQVLNDHFLDRPDWADGAEVVYMAVVGIALIFLLRIVGAAWCAIITLVAMALALGASWYAYTDYRFLTDAVTPSITIFSVYITVSLINFLQTEAEKKFVRGAMGQYLSPALVDQIAANPDLLKLGGETRNMTFLFCDVRGFTTISEQFKTNPQGLTRLMNRFLTPLTNVIMARQGTIDKYMGDCIMAFWNAPLDVPAHPQRACESALEMFREIDKLNVNLKAEAEAENRPFFAINIGIGLNSGDVVVGNMGSDQRFDYSVLGDAVNLASRLEGQSKTYGVNVVIGDTTYEGAKDEYATIEMDLIAVKGKKEAVRIHALLGDKAFKESPEFQAYSAKHHEMLALYRAQKWDETEALLKELRVMRPDLYGNHDLYEERIAEYRVNPPGEGWTGVYIATSK